MDNRVFDKTKLPSRRVTKGTSRAPHRSYLCVVNENLSKVVWNPEQDVIWSADKPITARGGVVGLRGSLAPEGAIVKVAGMPEVGLTFRGGSGMREMLWMTAALYGQGMGSKAALVNEGRFSGAMCGFCVDHAELEAAVDGPFELVRDGAIETEVIKETIDLQVGDAELEKRKKDWRPHKTNFGSGALWGYARVAGRANGPANGRGDAVASSETNAYADA
jgi:dihydroxy-acid dehydratase